MSASGGIKRQTNFQMKITVTKEEISQNIAHKATSCLGCLVKIRFNEGYTDFMSIKVNRNGSKNLYFVRDKVTFSVSIQT